MAHIKCFKCNKIGHYSDFFPDSIEGCQMYINALELLMSDHKDDEVEDESGATTQSVEGTEEDSEASNF